MKKVVVLTEWEKQTLEEGYRNSTKSHFRIRCQSMLMSDEGYKVKEISKLHKVRTRTIYTWIDKWESRGIVGLMIWKGRGVKGKMDELNSEQIEQVKEVIQADPSSLKIIVEKLSEWLGYRVSKYMLKRMLRKKLNYTWRRFRKCLKSLQFPGEYEGKLKELKDLLFLEQQGFLDVRYADESGFSLTPNIPYGWQPVNEPIRVKTARSKQINTFGLMNRNNELAAYTYYGTANAALIAGFIDHFAQTVTQRTAIVIDNASVHHSEEFEDKIKEWEEMDIYVFYLPRYSPHLNLIETLWRKMKYEWLKPKDYLNLKTLEAAIDHILCNLGIEFNINFSAPKVTII